MTDQYGPNTEEVTRFIASIQTVTLEQVQALGAARDAALGAILDAALAAALDAALGAARGAAWGAAWNAAWDAAWGAWFTRDAAWDAALALVVRDLISAEHFDILTGPWVSVMGPTWEKQR